MFIVVMPFHLSTYSVKTFPLTTTIEQTTDLCESNNYNKLEI